MQTPCRARRVNHLIRQKASQAQECDFLGGDSSPVLRPHCCVYPAPWQFLEVWAVASSASFFDSAAQTAFRVSEGSPAQRHMKLGQNAVHSHSVRNTRPLAKPSTSCHIFGPKQAEGNIAACYQRSTLAEQTTPVAIRVEDSQAQPVNTWPP